MDDFSKYPKSLTEIKSDKTKRAEDTTPRDALVAVLRKLDAGEIAPEVLMICYSQVTPDGFQQTGFHASSKRYLESLGLLLDVMSLVRETGERR